MEEIQTNQKNIESIGLRELPYVKHVPSGRIIWVYPYYDVKSQNWTAYIPQPEQKFIKMHPKVFCEGYYIALSKEKQNDFLNPLANILFQHFSSKRMLYLLTPINSDIIGILSMIHNYFIINNYASQNNNIAICSIIRTLLENALTIHRSFYDLINKIVKEIIRNSIFTEEYKKTHSYNLPDSFNDMIDENNQLKEKYAIPPALIAFYSQERLKKFATLKDIRDKIIHRGATIKFICKLENGYGMQTDEIPKLKTLGIWDDKTINNLGSILMLLVFVMKDMFSSLESLANAIEKDYSDCLPEAISPGFSIFLRHDFMYHYHNAKNYIENPWIDPKSVLKINS